MNISMVPSSSYGLGIISALVGPLLCTIGFYIWDNYWKGSAFALNLFKCTFASIGFVVIVVIQQQNKNSDNDRASSFLDWNTNRINIGYLLLSSTLGIVIGDILWIYALQLLGAKRVIMLDMIKPFFAAFLGYFLLNEKLHYAAIGGVILTLLGVLLVSLENENNNNSVNNENAEDNQASISNNNKRDSTTEIDNSVPCEIVNSYNTDSSTTLSSPTKRNDSNDIIIIKAVESTTSMSKAVKDTSSLELNESKIAKTDDLCSSCSQNNNNHKLYSDEKAAMSNSTLTSEYQTIKFFHSDSKDDEMDDEMSSSTIIDQQRRKSIIINHPCHQCCIDDIIDNTNTNDANKNSSAENKNDSTSSNKNKILVGTGMSIINIVLDTYGSVLTKQYGKDMTIWEINLIRFGFAGICLLLVSSIFHIRDFCRYALSSKSSSNINKKKYNNNNDIIHGNNHQSSSNIRNIKHVDLEEENGIDLPKMKISINDRSVLPSNTTTTSITSITTPWYSIPLNNIEMTRSAWYRICAGTVFVTFLTPTLSNYALFQIALALALTLGSTGPLYSLFISHLILLKKQSTHSNDHNKKRQLLPSLQSVSGTLLAVAGIIVLAFRRTLPEED